jgi:hypothetical protein
MHIGKSKIIFLLFKTFWSRVWKIPPFFLIFYSFCF